MKLRNKRTGQVGNFIINEDHFECVDLDLVPEYRNIAELNKDWEDAPEEPKHWFITTDGRVLECNEDACWNGEKEIGNYFETKEEAEKAVEKLKAWERLKDSGFEFRGFYKISDSRRAIEFRHTTAHKGFGEDFHLLFGGKE